MRYSLSIGQSGPEESYADRRIFLEVWAEGGRPHSKRQPLKAKTHHSLPPSPATTLEAFHPRGAATHRRPMPPATIPHRPPPSCATHHLSSAHTASYASSLPQPSFSSATASCQPPSLCWKENTRPLHLAAASRPC